MAIKIKIFHTGKVYVSSSLPFKDKIKNPNPVQLSLLSSYGRKNRIWLPVSAYLIELKNLKILVDTVGTEKFLPMVSTIELLKLNIWALDIF